MIALSPTSLNLRHLRVFAAVGKAGSITRAAGIVHLSQPAVTQAVAKLEGQLGVQLFLRTGRGMALTAEGRRFLLRIERALDLLRRGVQGMGRRLGAADAQTLAARISNVHLRALLAIEEHSSCAAAARALGIAQPSVLRAARELEAIAGHALFTKSASGTGLGPSGAGLARAARLMNAEISQALQEIAPAAVGTAGRISVGTLPLARSTILPRAIERVLGRDPHLSIHVVDGPYAELIHALRHGDLDVLVGALRAPAPFGDVVQERFFDDRLGVFCGPSHPLRGRPAVGPAELARCPWVLAREGTPSRAAFAAAFPQIAAMPGFAPVETSSMILVRGLLQSGQRLTMISRHQVATEVATGTMVELGVPLGDPPRPIGMTTRKGWLATPRQAAYLDALRAEARALGQPCGPGNP